MLNINSYECTKYKNVIAIFSITKTIIKLLYRIVNIIIKYFNTFRGFEPSDKLSLYSRLFCSLQIINNQHTDFFIFYNKFSMYLHKIFMIEMTLI